MLFVAIEIQYVPQYIEEGLVEKCFHLSRILEHLQPNIEARYS